MSKESIEIDSDVLDSEINLKKTDSIDDILVQIEKYTQSTNLLSVSKDVESLKALFYTKLKSLDDESSEIEKEFKRARYIYLSIYFGLIFILLIVFF